MVKIKIENETKHAKFKRIASERTRKILYYLRLLGNCTNTASYDYSEEDTSKIFNAIETDLKQVKTMFKRKKRKEFSLG